MVSLVVLHNLFGIGSLYVLLQFDYSFPGMRETWTQQELSVWNIFHAIATVVAMFHCWFSPVCFSLFGISLHVIDQCRKHVLFLRHQLSPKQNVSLLDTEVADLDQSMKVNYGKQLCCTLGTLSKSLKKPLFIEICICYFALPFSMFYGSSAIQLITSKEIHVSKREPNLLFKNFSYVLS